MITLNHTVTIVGACTVKDGDKDVQVALLSASVKTNGEVNLSRTIQDKILFEANKEEILKDFAAFDEYAYAVTPEIPESVKYTGESE